MMTKKYYGIALLAFVALMALMYGGSVIISFEVAMGGLLIAGERGIDMGYNFLMDNPNFFQYSDLSDSYRCHAAVVLLCLC